jgi:hypothetical protein
VIFFKEKIHTKNYYLVSMGVGVIKLVAWEKIT